MKRNTITYFKAVIFRNRFLLSLVFCLLLPIVSIAGSNSVLLSWTAPGDDGTDGQADGYDIRYSTAMITEQNWASAIRCTGEPSPKASGETEIFLVTGLNEATTYYFAIKVCDEVPNWSALSNVISKTTEADTSAPNSITSLNASAGINNGEINITWTAPGDDGTSGTASLYAIRYSTEPINNINFSGPITDSSRFVSSPPAPLPGGTTQNFTITNLAPGVEYYVAIKSIDNASNISGLSNVPSAVSKYGIVLDADDHDNGAMPNAFNLAQNYPNPFNPSTVIEYCLPRASRVSLQVFNILGQLTTTLVDEYQSAGSQFVEWDASSQPSGIYFYRIETDYISESKRMVLLK